MSSDSNSNSNSSASPPLPPSSDSAKRSFTFTSQNSQRRVCSVVRWLQQGFGFAVDLGRLDTSATQNTGYGWIADENTGTHIFVEHRALICDDGTFHRLFANEFIECSVDFSLPRDKGRSKAYDVTGIAGRKLLCDYRQEAADNANNSGNGNRYTTGHNGNSSNNSNNNGNSSNTNGNSNNSNNNGNNGNRGPRQPRQDRQDRTDGEQPRRSRSTNRQSYNQNNGGRSSGNQGEPRPTTVQYIYYGTTAPPQGAPSPADLSGLQFPALPVQATEPNYITPTSGIPVPK